MKHIWKIYIPDYAYPIVTLDKDVAYRTRADAINAGKRVLITRMTLDNYKRQLLEEK